ncbi:MAG: hypothetical protein PGN11_03240 [Quadrisphaera sp.]
MTTTPRTSAPTAVNQPASQPFSQPATQLVSGPARVPKPLFRDPVWDGASDPTLIWNRAERTWWMFYTARRATSALSDDVAWVHGSDIGMATSADGGATWVYRGTARGLATSPGRHTYWAPEVIDDGSTYHMYLTCIDGVPSTWEGHPRTIRHYTSDDLWHWRYESDLVLSSDRVIDACVHGLPGGGYRLWYKDEAHGSHTYAADSDDLHHWRVLGPAVTVSEHEGPNVFELGGYYWMIVDEWNGQRVLRSNDLTTWREQGRLLQDSGAGDDDVGPGYHADVVVAGEEAYVFYFTHPQRPPSAGHEERSHESRRSSLQVARVRVHDDTLLCDRDEVLIAPMLRPGAGGILTEVAPVPPAQG